MRDRIVGLVRIRSWNWKIDKFHGISSSMLCDSNEHVSRALFKGFYNISNLILVIESDLIDHQVLSFKQQSITCHVLVYRIRKGSAAQSRHPS